jgi:excisionase family DNA binding protein
MEINEDVKEPLAKVPEIAQRMNTSDWFVYELVRRGGIPGVIKLGPKSTRFNRHVVDKWIEDGCPPVDGTKTPEAAHG